MERADGIEGAIVEFCRFARENGFNAGVRETMDALESVYHVGLDDPSAFGSALRSVLCSSKDEWDRFDEIFEAFWAKPRAVQPAESEVERTHSTPAAHSRENANVHTTRTNLSEAHGDSADPDWG